MGVEVKGDPDLAVPEPLTGNLGVHAIGEHVGCVGMPQVMEAEAWRARRMARVMAKTRAALAEEIRRDVPFERLFTAMFSVLQRRHERAGDGGSLELNVSDPEQMLDRFLQTCTVRQIRMLREIALPG